MIGIFERLLKEGSVTMLGLIMRTFGYLYHLVLGLFLLVVGAVGVFSSGSRLEISLLPWSDPTLGWVLFLGSLVGLGSLALAVTGKFSLLFRLWAAVVFLVMAYCYLLTGYNIGIGFTNVILLLIGALIAALGAWTGGKRRRLA